MTENYDDDFDNDTDDDSQDGRVTLTRQQIRAMERDAKQARKATEELEATRRELAFARVGTDFTDKQQRALLANLEGELTTDAIRAAAEELGFLAVRPDTASAEVAATSRIEQATAGNATEAQDDPLARLQRADREGGKAGLIQHLQSAGVEVIF